MYNTIKKFLNDGGKCLLIENDKPIGVILTVEEYELLQSKSQVSSLKSQTEEKTLFSENNDKSTESTTPNPIGETLAQELDYPGASAEIADIEAVDDVTLEDLGIEERSY